MMEIQPPPTRIKVIGLVGSLREESFTRQAVRIALQGAAEQEVETELLHLRDYELVFVNGKMSDDDAPADVVRLRKKVREAQGIILGTPEYHGSFSGVLKNALDLMGFSEFEGKVVGLVGVSGGALGAANALTSLQMVGRALHAWIVPQQASIPQAWRKFDRDGTLNDPALDARLREVGEQVARFARLHTSEKYQDFLRQWRQAMPNPGG